MQNNAQPDEPLILVAEDDPEIRELFRELFHDEGYRTLMATDGEGPRASVTECS